jgi:hypothetical protein
MSVLKNILDGYVRHLDEIAVLRYEDARGRRVVGIESGVSRRGVVMSWSSIDISSFHAGLNFTKKRMLQGSLPTSFKYRSYEGITLTAVFAVWNRTCMAGA